MTATQTEQQWLGNEPRTLRGSALAELDRAEALAEDRDARIDADLGRDDPADWEFFRAIGHPDRDRALPPAVDVDGMLAAASRRAAGEAALIAGMKRALAPFPRPAAEPKQGWEFPRAGVRRRPDGRYQLRIWLDPTLPDAVQGGACETLPEAYNLGAMICQYARDAA
jgi:hypothetical protein